MDAGMIEEFFRHLYENKLDAHFNVWRSADGNSYAIECISPRATGAGKSFTESWEKAVKDYMTVCLNAKDSDQL